MLRADGRDRHRDVVHRQIARIPANASHLILSVGGNDALGEVELLGEGAVSVAEVLDRLARIGAEFDLGYSGASTVYS